MKPYPEATTRQALTVEELRNMILIMSSLDPLTYKHPEIKAVILRCQDLVTQLEQGPMDIHLVSKGMINA